MFNLKPIIELKNIEFQYVENVKILHDVNFKIFPNEYVCIIGHNGSGKSTISKILTGLLKPKSGEILLNGEVITFKNIKNLRNAIGAVFQNPDNQFVGMAVENDIAFGLENRKYPSEKMPEIIRLVTTALGIEDLLSKDASQLSGGQKQKVAIAGVLALNPEVIIFDEATSMLDPKSKKELKELMVNLKTTIKKTVISITHDMEEVLNADKVIFLNHGKVEFIGSPIDFFTQNKNLSEGQLDYPFIIKLSKQLNELGLKIDITTSENEFLKQWQKIK